MSQPFATQLGQAAKSLGIKTRIPATYRGMVLNGTITRREINRLRLTLVKPTGWAKGIYKVLRFRQQGREVFEWGAVRLIEGYKDTFAVYQKAS